MAGQDQGVQLGVAQLDKGEFGRDKETVDQDDGQDGQQMEGIGGQDRRSS